MTTMIKKPVKQLEGAQLDWAVAKVSGSTDAVIEQWATGAVCVSSHNAFEAVPFSPSSNWSDGGPVIDREWISVGNYYYDMGIAARNIWTATKNTYGVLGVDIAYGPGASRPKYYFGETPLIAAMRAFVASKLGEEVEVPV